MYIREQVIEKHFYILIFYETALKPDKEKKNTI